MTFGNVIMKMWIRIYILQKFYTVFRELILFFHHRSLSKVLPKEDPKICVKFCVFTRPMMNWCKILNPIWFRKYLIGPYLGNVTSGPMMNRCTKLVSKWSCSCFLGPNLCILTLDKLRTNYDNLKALKY